MNAILQPCSAAPQLLLQRGRPQHDARAQESAAQHVAHPRGGGGEQAPLRTLRTLRTSPSAPSRRKPWHSLGTPSAPTLRPPLAVAAAAPRQPRRRVLHPRPRRRTKGRGSRARPRPRPRPRPRARCALSVGAGGAAGQIALRVGLTSKTARGVEKLRVHIGEAPGPGRPAVTARAASSVTIP